MLDFVIAGGLVVDGTGSPGKHADVGVRHGQISVIGDLSAVEAGRRLDATGQVVAPGFIDIHSHSDFTLLVDPRAFSSISQGVTTEVIGNCGHGCAPIGTPAKFTGNIYGYHPETEIDWHTTGEYLDRLSQQQPSVNVAALVPNGNLRLTVIADTGRPAHPHELERMIKLLEESLGAGAWGLSSGLEYPLERHASEAELTALCSTVGRVEGIYSAHTRNRERKAVESVEEAIRTASKASVRLQVSHIVPRRGGSPDALKKSIESIESAADSGVDVTFDSHTRLHGITNLSAALPLEVATQEPAALRAELLRRNTRATVRSHSSIISSFSLGGWENIQLFAHPAQPELEGNNFEQMIPPGGDGWDVVCDVLAAAAENPHATLVLCHSYEESEVVTTMRHPLCMPASDATALSPGGALRLDRFPGAYSWAGWFFSRVTKNPGGLTIEDAVYRMTGMPAERMGLIGRGKISEGNMADLVVFDPNGFAETATLEDPNRICTGVRHVTVNGVIALEDGKMTDHKSGLVLRKS